MADTDTQGPGPIRGLAPIDRATTVSVAIALSYARAFDRGVELEYSELHQEISRARIEATRVLETGDARPLKAVVIGYEHALIARTKGESAVPRMFFV